MEFDAVLLPPRRAESVARLLARAIKLIVDADWPPRAVTMCAGQDDPEQYRIQFLDRSANVIREWSANAQDVAGACVPGRSTDPPWLPSTAPHLSPAANALIVLTILFALSTT